MDEFDFYDVRQHTDLVHEGLPDREFILWVKPLAGKLLGFKSRKSSELIAQAISWRGRATWAGVSDYRGKRVLSLRSMVQLWAADAGYFGVPSAKSPFIVRGPTVNPTCYESFWSLDILGAVTFAKSWLENWYDDPYHVTIYGPNGAPVLTNPELQRLYLADVNASGRQITESLVRVANGQATVESSRVLT